MADSYRLPPQGFWTYNYDPEKRIQQLKVEHEKRVEELIFDLSQETAARERLQTENTRLQNKLARLKASLRGQEKLWLQTKVRLQKQIIDLQEQNEDFIDKIRSLEQ